MSLLVLRIPANFILNRAVIIYFEGWHFTVYSHKKNSFDSVTVAFLVRDDRRCDIERNVFHVFYFFITEKMRVLFKREKSYARFMEKVYSRDCYEIRISRIPLFMINVYNDLVFTCTNT